MNELERTTLNEILRTVTYIAERVDRLGEQLYPHLTETDKKEVLALINDALSKGRGISDNDLDGVKFQSNTPHNGFLIRKRGESYNMPTQRSMDMSLFEVKERTHNEPNGSIRISKTTKMTGKGQTYFINKFLNQAGAG